VSRRPRSPSWTTEHARRELRAIQRYAGRADEESAVWASRDELLLWERTLMAIANGESDDPVECARLALCSRGVAFQRSAVLPHTGFQVPAYDEAEDRASKSDDPLK